MNMRISQYKYMEREDANSAGERPFDLPDFLTFFLSLPAS